MSNVDYSFDGDICYGKLKDGTVFITDRKFYPKIRDINLYRNSKTKEDCKTYIIDCNGNHLHRILIENAEKMEIDHINLNTFDNRSCNLRICTHQQNQCNQPLQKNNTSGVTGVSYYKPRHKYRARIKISQQDIHLGYYETFVEAVQARNTGMEYMFGEYGRYNDVDEAPKWIKEKVNSICSRFANLSLCKTV
ncbi:MAG: HNH endonuclease [Firmicutes bacterium]|nr:HNH endonuclease [Bacillota bacterium]